MAKSNNLLGNILDTLGDAVQSKPASRQKSGLDGMLGELLEGMIGKEQKSAVRKNETENSGSLPDAISNLVEDMIAPGNKSASATAKKTGKQKSSAASKKPLKRKRRLPPSPPQPSKPVPLKSRPVRKRPTCEVPP